MRVELTELGANRIQEGFVRHNEDLDQLFSLFTEEERADFDRLMTRLGQQAEGLLDSPEENSLKSSMITFCQVILIIENLQLR